MRAQGKGIGLICYFSIEIPKIQEKSGYISLISTGAAHQEKILELLIDHAVTAFTQEDIPVICAGIPEKFSAACTILQAKQFACSSTQQSLCIYIKMSESFQNKMKEAAEQAEKEGQSPFITHLTNETVAQIMQSKEPAILDIYSNNCPPCRRMIPIMKELAEAHQGTYAFAKFNIEDKSEFINNIMKEYSLKGIPAFVFIKDGNHGNSCRVHAQGNVARKNQFTL